VVGQRALVVQRIAEHGPGQVRVRDEVWRAAPAPGAAGPFEPGAEVTVEGVDGVTLRVR
jgi:membrane protein implicated in regulation of membrane protease activity